MTADAVDRLAHVKEAIRDVRNLLKDRTRSELEGDSVLRAAFERFVEIISEASRHIPSEWKARFGPEIPWRDIANVGNVLRHVYDRVEVDILWAVDTDDLDPLETAIDAMLAVHGNDGQT
jgi:uncharacterized protein with HEPN domain